MTNKIPFVSIVGRTNVGKSTLFNSIVGKRITIVEDSPGVTRDRTYRIITKYDKIFNLIDTGGVAGDEDPRLQKLVKDQTEIAIRESSLIIAVFDGLEGVHANDSEVTHLLREYQKPVIWVVNKCEKEISKLMASEFYSLGISDILSISAQHNIGIKELIQKIQELLPSQDKGEQHNNILSTDDSTISESILDNLNDDNVDVLEDINNENSDLEDEISIKDDNSPIKVALVGKPNVGKSSLMNQIAGTNRVVTSDIPGTTRDSIDVEVFRNNKKYIFVDTAGLRKKARIEDESIERYSNIRAINSLTQCDVAVLVLDGTEGAPSSQDLKIASLIHERGCGFLIVINKWDNVEKNHKTVKMFKDIIYSEMNFAKYAPILFVSAVTGKRCPAILDMVNTIYNSQKQKIKTSDLNRTIRNAFETKPPPIRRGKGCKVQFTTQVGTAPPTFVLLVTNPSSINYAYERYLKNAIRKDYEFIGVDLKFQIRQKKKPDEK